MRYLPFVSLLSLHLLWGCQQPEISSPATGGFVHHTPERTGVDFQNTIAEDEAFNYFTFPYMYLGAGVATADFDNDGYTDVFFTGNMVPNRLYRNARDWRFDDISTAAGVAGVGRWYTGVTIVDINNDGWQDIYLSVSGKDGDRSNQLFVNLGADAGAEVRFEEQAMDYGIADSSPSIQGAFFDYDRDGDLDLYVINYPPAPFSSSNRYYRKRMEDLDLADSDHLYRNNGDGTFSDVSETSGIANYGLSLGLSVADFNGDGWDDLYISNDFSTPDRYLQNNQDGTFTDHLRTAFAQTSLFGMGCDAADYNNDGKIDLVQADMTPADNRRAKENMASMNPGAFWSNVRNGFHFQYMYNCLQLNRGGPTETPFFSNSAQLAGLAATDWSWSPLLADLDNDGHKDLFITNGIKREVNNRDFHQDLKIKINFGQTLDSIDYRRIPSEPVPNFAFRNLGNLSFEDAGATWGLDLKGFSNGSTYADLDNDGDLDLVVSNIDAPAAIYENQVTQKTSLTVKLQGPSTNRNAVGARITVTAAG
ncbi:MAG: VCBS repeat-containing protein, partial [Bacteroidota bacterium]